MNAAFTPQALGSYEAEVSQVIDTHLERWRGAGSILAYDCIKSMALDIVFGPLLHLDRGAAQAQELERRFRDYGAGLFFPPFRFPGSPFSRALAARTYILAQIDQSIQRRLDDTRAGTQAAREDVLQLMLDAVDGETGRHFGRDELGDQVLLQLFAGHETVTSAMTGMVHFLAANPEVRLRAVQELEAVDAGEGDPDLPYLTAVIKEVLRIHPPVGGGFRVALKTFELEAGDGTKVQVPAGAKVLYSIAVTMANMSLAGKGGFSPERWLDNGAAAPSPFEFCPFGAGRRQCPGYPLAMFVMKLFGAALLRQCDWRVPSEEITWNFFPTPKPNGGLPISVRPRSAR